jgi:hypothetical protein
MSPEVMQVGARLNQRSRAKYVADARKRVARGAKWLDQQKPNWFRKVRTTQLRMDHGLMCVLGQLYSPGDDQWDETGYSAAEKEHPGKMKWGGFITLDTGGPTYDELQAAWLDAIATRRKAARTVTR